MICKSSFSVVARMKARLEGAQEREEELEQVRTICSEFCHKGKETNGLEAAGEGGKERADLFVLVFEMTERTACVQAHGKDLPVKRQK